MTDSVGAVTFSQKKEEFNKSLQGEQSVEVEALWEPLRAAPSLLPCKWANPQLREDSCMQEML